MREQGPRLKVLREGDITLIEFTDRKILDEITITQVSEQLLALAAEPGRPRLVLDFSDVAHMSSSALGTLITLHKRVQEKDGQMRLCGIQPAIHEVFVITRLNEIFDICPTRQEALDSLQ